MKKLITAMSFLIGLGLANAQQVQPNKTASPVKTTKAEKTKKATPAKVEVKAKTTVATGAKLKKDGTPDKRYKQAQHLKKDGTPDKRFKENKK